MRQLRTTPSRTAQLVALLLGAGATLAACGGEDSLIGDGKADASKVDASTGGDTGGLADSGALDTQEAEDTASAPDVTLPDTGEQPSLSGAFEQIAIPGDVNTSWHACWTQGSTLAYLAGTGGNIAGWNGNAWATLSEGTFQTLHGVAASTDGGLAHAVGIGGTLVQGKQTGPGPAGQWGPPGGCKATADCEDSDVCTADFCDAGVCRHTPSGAAGCCGSKPVQDGFTSLAGWTVKDTYEKVADQGGIVWSASAMTDTKGKALATSPPKALYFGRIDVPCVDDATKVCPTFDNGKVVGSTALSQPFTLPPATKTAQVSLTFQLRMEVENGTGFDALTVKVVEGAKKTEVWSKAKLGGAGSTDAAFALQVVDLTGWAGKQIQLEIAFDSKDASMNATEGVFIDDFIVSTVCKSGETAVKGITDATFFDVWAADDSHAWAVGTGGTIARWDGATWKLETGATAPRDTLAMAGVAGGLALGVGQKGKASLLQPGGLGALETGAPQDLVDVDVDPTAAAGSVQAIAVSSTNVAYEYDGQGWKMSAIPGVFGLKGVAAMGDGTWIAVGGATIVERSKSGLWTPKTSVGGALNDVTSLGGGKAFAVGTGGLLVERIGGVWTEKFGTLGMSNMNAVHAADPAEAWAVGESGVAARWHAGAWAGIKTGTGKHLLDVWTYDADLAWVVGLADTILRWDGTKFEAMKSPLEGVDWIAVWGSDPSDVYLAGKGGIVARWDGVKFQILESPVLGTLRDVHGFGPNDVWVVGSAGGIYHSAGGGWTRVPIEPFEVPEQPPYLVESDLYAIWGSAPNDIWASGAPDSNGQGVLVHYDGKAWRYSQALTKETRTVRAIWGRSATDVLLAGTQGMIYRFDGKSLQALESGSIASFFAICGWGKDALITGSIGTVLRYLPPPPQPGTTTDASP